MARVRERVAAKNTTAFPPDVVALAIEVEKARLAANEANRIGSAAKKKLFALLEDKKLREVNFQTKALNGKPASINISKQGGQTSVLNVKKFKSKVSESVFMKCVVVQKGLADKYAGNALRTACETTEDTDPTWGITTTFLIGDGR